MDFFLWQNNRRAVMQLLLLKRHGDPRFCAKYPDSGGYVQRDA